MIIEWHTMETSLVYTVCLPQTILSKEPTMAEFIRTVDRI